MENVSLSLQEQVHLLAEYMCQNYEFRHNVLSDKYEVREKNAKPSTPFRPLTREAVNSISRRIKADGLEIQQLRQNLEEFIYSEETTKYDPIGEYLEYLPKWDGQDHVADLFGRIPGITPEQHYLLGVWIRSMVAHWMGMDILHGNECVVTLIGDQGCGKSTWCSRLLPPHLRTYYLDHINLSNKFDKEMALTNNLLVNIDEMDQIKPGQHAQLKQTLSKPVVEGRPIYGREQKTRRRYASFVATTNNQHPLTDRTGNRRYLCVRIPENVLIDNDSEINYPQLYAQIVHQLRQEQQRYWFTNEEVKRIEALNLNYQSINDLESMVDYCFRPPLPNETVKPMLVSEVVRQIADEFPSIKMGMSTSVKVGCILKERNYERKNITQGHAYYIVSRKTA